MGTGVFLYTMKTESGDLYPISLGNPANVGHQIKYGKSIYTVTNICHFEGNLTTQILCEKIGGIE